MTNCCILKEIVVIPVHVLNHTYVCATKKIFVLREISLKLHNKQLFLVKKPKFIDLYHEFHDKNEV